MFTVFYDAWWFLHNHPLFKDEYKNSKFLDCLNVEVMKVNPITCKVDDSETMNTKVEVWLEAGPYDKNCKWHDIDLDCGGDTYELAIIKLANKVLEQYENSVDKR